MRYAAALVSLLWAAAPAFASDDPSNLVATGRTDTQLYLQWDANGNTFFTVDYLGPETFGDAQPTCSDFPQHSNIFETGSDPVIIGGLQHSTWYHIHVHALDANHHTLGGSTNVIIVRTRAAGSSDIEPLSPGSPDYIICGSGGGGGGGGGADLDVKGLFNDPTGSVVFSTNGDDDVGRHVALSPAGDAVYVLVHSGDIFGDQPHHSTIGKFNLDGSFTGIVTELPHGFSGDAFALDSQGLIYVGVKEGTKESNTIGIGQLDGDLTLLNAIEVDKARVGHITRGASDGTYFYTVNDGGFPDQAAKIIKYDSSLNELASKSLSATPGTHNNGDAIAVADGMVYALVSENEESTSPRLLAACDAATLQSCVTADVTSLLSAQGEVAGMNGEVWIAGGADPLRVYRLDARLNVLAERDYPGISGVPLVTLRPGLDGNMYLIATKGLAFDTSGAPTAGDYVVLKLSPNLETLATALFDGPAHGVDGGAGLAVELGGGTVLATGGSSNGLDLDAVTVRLAPRSARPTPAQLCGQLQALIGGLPVAAGTKQSLAAKADAACAAIARGNTHAASGLLGALQNEASAQSGKKLTAGQAASLTAAGQAVLDALR